MPPEQEPQQEPTVTPPVYEPASSPVAPSTEQPKKRSVKKKILIVLGVVIGLVITAVIAIYLFAVAANKPTKYSDSDLQTEKTASFSIARPKEWEDLTNNDAVKKLMTDKLGEFGKNIVDQKAYGHKYDPETDSGLDFLYAASFKVDAGDLTESQFRSALTDPGVRKEVEKGFADFESAFEDKDRCSKTNPGGPFFKYPASEYVYTLTFTYGCTYKPEHQSQNVLGYHMEVSVKAKHNQAYMVILISADNDWLLNEDLYLDKVVGPFPGS